MNIEELNANIKAIELEAQNSINLAKRKYAIANNVAIIGDIVEDHIGKVRVTDIKCYLSDVPECIYYGDNLTKKGTVNKLVPTRGVYQGNLIGETK